MDGQGTKWRRNIAENFNRWVGRTNVTDRQTDDRRTGDSIWRTWKPATMIARRRPTNILTSLMDGQQQQPFNGPLSGTTRVSRYQKGRTNLDFTEVRQWVAVASAGSYASLHLALGRYPRQHPTTQFFTGRILFLPPNQQCHSTEGIWMEFWNIYYILLTKTGAYTIRNRQVSQEVAMQDIHRGP